MSFFTEVCRGCSEHIRGGALGLTNANWHLYTMDRAGSLYKGPASGQGRKINIYTDSHYTFATAHVHGTIYKERELLTAEEKTIKSKEEILGLLKVLWKPNKMAFIHCPGHHKGNGPIPRGNKLAVKTTWEVAVQTDPVLAAILVDPGFPALLEVPKYTQEELTWIVSPFDTMSRKRVVLSWL